MEKISEMIERLCPERVERVKLVDCAYVLYGYPFESTLFSEDEANIPLIRIRDVVPGKASTYYTGEYQEEYLIHKGDILVGMDGNFNLATWNDRDGLLNQRVCKISSKDNLAVDGFLYHILGPIFKIIEQNTSGGSVKHLSAKIINHIEIPLPPLSIQQEIVRILDCFTSMITNLETELASRQKQYEHYRNKLLTFDEKDESIEWKTLGELFEFKNGLNKEKEAFGHGTPIVNYTDVYKNRGLYRNTLNGLVNLNDSEIARYSVKKGDVFFTRTSETKEEVGYPAVMLDDIEQCTFSGFVLKAHPLTDLLIPDYCKYCFFSFSFRQEVIKRATLTTRALTNGKSLSKITIPIPTLQHQQEIVSILDTFESLISNIKQELDARKKQYEYYREQLLTFRPSPALP